MENGYFIVECREDGTYLHILPGKDGGADVSLDEVTAYLEERKLDFDVIKLDEAINKSEDTILKLNGVKNSPQRENYALRISSDQMSATLRFYPSSPGGEALKADEVYSDLKAKGITSGVCNESIDSFFNNKKYCTDYVAAQGKPVRNGTDDQIEYLFETNKTAKPEVREDGSVDFHNLNTICRCHKGDVLARLIPADPGEAGENIYGEVLKPRDVRRLKLQFGRNIVLSEDGSEITSEVDGHVTLAGKKVFVSNVMEVENVDNSTGDIEYDGNVQINGNVASNFKVKASGNIEVRGVVEAAELIAGGNIVIAKGMNGMSKGILNAGGSVVAKYLESAKVSAGTFISTESIRYCDVQSGQDIEVTGKKGFITGGNTVAGGSISVNNLGATMGAATRVEVGVNANVRQEQKMLREKLEANKKTISMVEPALKNFYVKSSQGVQVPKEQLAKIQELALTRKKLLEENEEISDRLSEMSALLVSSQNPSVKVKGNVYSGVTISILDSSKTIKDAIVHCRFVREKGDIKMETL